MSVVLSVYNGGPYLAEAVESVLGQTFGDLELVAIDDGSTDGSGAVLDRYAAGDPRVRVLHQENRGLIASLNRGLGEARGALVARMDADDVSLPDRLQKQVDYLDATPEVGVVGGLVRYVDAGGAPTGGQWPTWHPPELNGWRLLFQTVLCHPTVVMRREVLDRTGGYDAKALHAEDYELWTRMLFETSIANLPDVVLERRKWDGTIGAQHAERQEQTVVESMRVAHERILGRSVEVAVVADARRVVGGGGGAVPPSRRAALAAHLRRLGAAYVARLGHRAPAVEEDVHGLIMGLARTDGGVPFGPLWHAGRVAPGRTLRRLGGRLTRRLGL